MDSHLVRQDKRVGGLADTPTLVSWMVLMSLECYNLSPLERACTDYVSLLPTLAPDTWSVSRLVMLAIS